MSSRQQHLFDVGPAPTPWETAAETDRLVASIVFNRPLDTVYHYLVPDSLRPMVRPGQRVRVPFGRGNTATVGYCVAVSNEAPTSKRLKSVDEILDREPLLTETMLELTQWISERYLCSWGQVLEGVVPAGVKKQAGTREITCYLLTEGIAEQLSAISVSKKQRSVLEVLASTRDALPVDEISRRADCGVAPINALREKKLITAIRRRTDPLDIEIGAVAKQADLILNTQQQRVLDRILEPLRKGVFESILLHGITGSGKTEVYIRAIREVLAYGRQAIVLVPEISLTPQTIRRFRARFDSVSVLHSHLSDAERHWHWQQIANGDVQVVVGARSAIFAPAPHLGLIVIDEEHETTFKQQNTPRYHAREVARERARREGIPLILGSATPTLESLLRAKRKEDVYLSLPHRVEMRPLPPVVVVDTRNDPFIAKGHSIGRAMKTAIESALRDGGQVILFLNLRGYSPVMWCPRCGGMKCPDCDITLTWHKDRKHLLCHSCDYECPPPERCPACGLPGLRFLGTGTQRLESELHIKFPDVRVLRMDSDSMRKPGSHDIALESFREGKVEILLGTQMIAKGLDFPNVTLVGVIDADTMLHQPDMRSSERTFQLISQVAGRTGRGEKGGKVFVQTMQPDEPVIRMAAEHDFVGFAKRELQMREEMGAPPFTTMARVILRGPDESIVQSEIKRVTQIVRDTVLELKLPIRVLGPAPAPIMKLKKHFRFHFQLTSPEIQHVTQLWKFVVPKLTTLPEIEYTIDVDPLEMR